MKKKFFILLITIIFGIALGYLMFVFSEKNNNKTFEKRINELIENHNEINKIFSKTDEQKSYYNDFGTKCSAYKGKDLNEYIEKIKETYYYTLDDLDVFELKNNKLYICVPEYCKTLDIDKSKIKISDEDNNNKILHYKSESIILKKDKNVWKFGAPILDCDIQKMMEKNTK